MIEKFSTSDVLQGRCAIHRVQSDDDLVLFATNRHDTLNACHFALRRSTTAFAGRRRIDVGSDFSARLTRSPESQIATVSLERPVRRVVRRNCDFPFTR